jgi:hypothetical protein
MNYEGIGEIPSNIDPQLRRVLQSIRNNLVKVQQGVLPPGDPANLQVTPIAGGNVVQFTRANDADNTVLYMGNLSDISAATPVPLGLSVKYTDNVGKGAVTRFYWIRSMRGLLIAQNIIGPVKGISLALGVNATLPVTPIASDLQLKDTSANRAGSVVRRWGAYDVI